MKIFTKSLILLIIFLTAAAAAAQTSGSVWTVDAIKSNEGQQANLLRFYEQNWARARQTLKEQGKIKSFRVLSVKPEKSQPWDVMLLTEYADREAFEKREAIFAEVFKTQKTILINGKSGRDMSKFVNLDLGYDQPISSEKISELMNKAEIEAARIPLENYLKGHATGNPEFMRKAFHTEGKLIFIRDGKYTTRTFEEYIAGMSGKPAEDEAKRKRWIESVEVSGNAAVGKIILDYPTVKFVDYMSMLKIDGEWKIINKSFHAEPKSEVKK